MTRQEKYEISKTIKMLELYKDILLARHAKEPLKSPPLFGLTIAISNLKLLKKGTRLTGTRKLITQSYGPAWGLSKKGKHI